jgi:hypothetical protein
VSLKKSGAPNRMMNSSKLGRTFQSTRKKGNGSFGELQRRGLPKPDPPIGSCPACGRPVARFHQGDQCSQCGEPLPPDILRALGAAAIESTDDMTVARASDGESLTVNWELVRCVGASFSLQRAKIPGGWLVASGSDGALTFVPDAEHKWNENSS